MAFDPEEFKQRRAQREQQRQKRQQQQRSLMIRLAIAGIALLLCTVLVLVLVRSGSQKPEDTQSQTSGSVQEQAQTSTPTETPPRTVIRLAAAGDLNVTEAVINSGGADHDYTDTLMDVTPLLADADITVINFEGNLCGAPYGTDRSAPQSLALSLSKAGVDLLQLANSYSIYKGMDGLSQTIDAVRLAAMEPLGVYATAADAKAADDPR